MMRVFGPGDPNVEPKTRKTPNTEQSRPIQEAVGARVLADGARDQSPIQSEGPSNARTAEGAVVVSERVQIVQARHEEETARHAARVEVIREALESGTYQVDAEKLAERLLDEDLALRRNL